MEEKEYLVESTPAVAFIITAYANLDSDNRALFIRSFVSKINSEDFSVLLQTVYLRKKVKYEGGDEEDVNNKEDDWMKEEEETENAQKFCSVSMEEEQDENFKFDIGFDEGSNSNLDSTDDHDSQNKVKIKRTFDCQFCSKSFQHKCNLIIHIRKHRFPLNFDHG